MPPPITITSYVFAVMVLFVPLALHSEQKSRSASVFKAFSAPPPPPIIGNDTGVNAPKLPSACYVKSARGGSSYFYFNSTTLLYI